MGMGIRIVPFVILIGGAGWYLSHPLSVNSLASAGTMHGKVAAVDPSDLVAHPVTTPTALPRPCSTPRLVAETTWAKTGLQRIRRRPWVKIRRAQ